MIVLLDLDGPVLDVRAKYHAAFSEVLEGIGLPEPPEALIWELRRRGAGGPELLDAAGATGRISGEEYRARFAALVEEDRLLDLDTLQAGVGDAFGSLRRVATDLVLVTLRRRRAGVERQLNRLGVASRFDAILVAEGNDGRPEVKRDLVLSSGLAMSGLSDVLIGDTESDVTAARLLGARAFAVSCGLRDAARLAAARPDAVATDLSTAAKLLLAERRAGGGPGFAPGGEDGPDR